MKLSSKCVNFKDGYRQLLRADARMCHADELMTGRRNNPHWRDQRIYAADGMIYFVEKEIPKLAITRIQNNPFLRNIDDAVEQLASRGNYRPTSREVSLAIHAQDTVIIDLTEVGICPKSDLTGTNNAYGYITIPTTGYHGHLNYPELKKVVQRLYGRGRDFVRNMKMLSDVGIEQTRIYLPTPDYVREQAAGSPISLVTWLNSFRFNSNVISDDYAFSDDHYIYGVTPQQELELKETMLRTRPYQF